MNLYQLGCLSNCLNCPLSIIECLSPPPLSKVCLSSGPNLGHNVSVNHSYFCLNYKNKKKKKWTEQLLHGKHCAGILHVLFFSHHTNLIA